MARRATRPDPTSRPNGATDSRRRRSSARNNRPLRDGPATDNLTTSCYSLRSSRAGHGVGDLPMEIEVIPESQDVQEPLDRPEKRGEPLDPPQHQGGGDTLQQKNRCEARAAVGKSFSGWHELNSTVGDACCRKTSQHRSSTSRADNEVSIAGDELSPQIVADSSRDDALRSSSAENGALGRGGEDRTQQTFRRENTTTEEVSRSSSSSNNNTCIGVGVQNRQSELSDNGDEAKTPRQSHEVERGVIDHVIVAGEGQQTTAATMVTSPDHWERKVSLDLTTDSVVTPPDAAPSAGARPSGETSVGNAMSPRVSQGVSPGVTCESGERGATSDGFGEGAGGGGESRCFRKSGEKQLLFMIIANPGLCPNKESSNNLRERAWGIVRELVTRPTPVEVTLKDGNTQTVTVALDSEQLTDHALKKRWQMYRGKYERRAKEHSKSQAAGKGVGEGPVGDVYLDDGSSESLWLAKAVRAWDVAKLKKRRNSALAETAAAVEAEAAITTEGCSRWEARETKNASDGLVVAPTAGGVSLASPDLNEGSMKRAAGEASAMSPTSTPNKRPRTEVVGHDSAKDTCLQDNSGVSNHSIGEDNRDRDVGKGLVQLVEGAADAGDPSGLHDLSASASANAAAGSDGGVLHPASSKACGDGTPLSPPSTLPRGWSTPKEMPGGDDASAASLPSSAPRRAGDSGETLPVAEQLMSLLAQKTAAELEAKRVETDLKRAQAEALRRGGGRAPAEVAAPGRIAPVPRVGHAFGGLRDAASAADAPAVSVRDALSSLAGQVQGLRADVWSIRDESRRLREELRETNSGVRLLLERFAFSSSSYPSAGGAPSFGGGGGIAGASSPLTNDEVGAGHQHPRPPETDHFGAVAQGLGPVRW